MKKFMLKKVYENVLAFSYPWNHTHTQNMTHLCYRVHGKLDLVENYFAKKKKIMKKLPKK